jgi:NAD(P)-dependent dehydrogenase (short-subunit alcohol dehydrogenase family)
MENSQAFESFEVLDYNALLRLDGKRFVVIGAGQGIGREVCHALHDVGAQVLCVDLDQNRARMVADEVAGIAWSGDVTDRDQVEALFQVVAQEFGNLDGVVDIVGLATYRPILQTTDEEWNAQHNIVLRHVLLCIQAATPHLISSGGGTMTFVASIAGFQSAANHAAYGAAKAGLMSLVRSAAEELGEFGIRVNAIAPGLTATPRLLASSAFKAMRAANETTTPLGRIGSPSDIASGLLYFSLPLSRHVTGQVLVIDGGQNQTMAVSMPWDVEEPPWAGTGTADLSTNHQPESANEGYDND